MLSPLGTLYTSIPAEVVLGPFDAQQNSEWDTLCSDCLAALAIGAWGSALFSGVCVCLYVASLSFSCAMSLLMGSARRIYC
jgi:hypothetical protein